MLTRKNIDKIKKWVGWEHKPDGAIEALVELCIKAREDSMWEPEHERGNRELGPF